MVILHILNTGSFSGAENVVISINGNVDKETTIAELTNIFNRKYRIDIRFFRRKYQGKTRERKNKIRTDKENVCRRNKKGYKKI